MSGGSLGRRTAPLGIALLLAAGAVFATATTPDDVALTSTFASGAAPGEIGEGRTFAVRLDGVRVADAVAGPLWTGETSGAWVVAEVTAEARANPGGVTGALLLGDLRFQASPRPPGLSIASSPLQPGLPESGALVFEVPLEALEAHGAGARIAVSGRSDPRLDSSIEIPVDLSAVDRERRVELAEPERSGW
ncbi:hypothetical protein [Homoserinibacter sp. YIM 151385]|uniref:hypothetical protein n=1 Tax=Homoserinibacter sp. YIM 151385 TaxID=2985506 RepID=UPI0022F0F1E9|nr:hypothetical protein [Homoserinibacter sp. YIM 151385]WBU38351.1 hypothetical protein OF852_01840 [Homoserinibacter sp. YIM 151385]